MASQVLKVPEQAALRAKKALLEVSYLISLLLGRNENWHERLRESYLPLLRPVARELEERWGLAAGGPHFERFPWLHRWKLF